MIFHSTINRFYIIKSILAAIFGVMLGGIFLVLAGHPLSEMRHLFAAGFGCGNSGSCAFLTMLQFATPLILSGLSAAIAFRAGFFSLGQAGQMLLGAGAAAWIGGFGDFGLWHPIAAIFCSALIGAVWAFIPGLLKVILNVNEVISSILLNSIAAYVLGIVPMKRGPILESAKLLPLSSGTKLNSGIMIALTSLLFVYLFLWQSRSGYAIRMGGQAPLFARFGGLNPNRSVLGALFLSGVFSGIAGAVEVLGVHYRFITDFSGDTAFDGVMVALLGHSHPIGILLSAIFVGGIRLGALNGLMIKGGIPRELGNAILAMVMIFMAVESLNFSVVKRISKKFLEKIRLFF